jgi:hypothetical protein
MADLEAVSRDVRFSASSRTPFGFRDCFERSYLPPEPFFGGGASGSVVPGPMGTNLGEVVSTAGDAAKPGLSLLRFIFCNRSLANCFSSLLKQTSATDPFGQMQ